VQGYIKLYRKIRENPVFNNMELFRLWMICLTEATHKERDQIVGRQVVHLMPGDFVTGRFDLQSMYNRGLSSDQQKSPKTVWRWLEALENGHFLTIKTTNKFSVVSILNWHKYQIIDQQNEQQVTNKRPTNDQQVTTNNNVKNDLNGFNVLKESTTTPNAFVVFEREGFGTISSTLAEKLGSFIDDFGERWVIEAMKEAAYHSKRSLPYVKSILEDYRRRGVDEPWTVERTQQQKGFNRQQTKTGKPEMRVVSGSPAPEISQEERQRMRELARELKTS
jgi:DnaD and phage-associated domain